MTLASESATLVSGLPPWLDPTWQRLLQARRDGRLGQALLISGPSGIGKRWLLDRLIGLMLCAQPTTEGDRCGACADCRLLDTAHHPDKVLVEPDPERASQEIRADQVRDLCNREGLTPTRGVSKVLVLRPAEAMNAFAANSLLKTLEEPVASSLWVLVSERPQRLPQTIRSRCQRVELAVPRERDALPWLRARLGTRAPERDADVRVLLRLAQGAPLRALELATSGGFEVRQTITNGLAAVGEGQRDPIALAGDWQSYDLAELVVLMIDWVADLLRLAIAPRDARLVNLDMQPVLESLAQRLDPDEGHRYLRRLLQTRGFLDASVNKQLLVESLLVRWAAIMQPRE